MRRVRPDGVVTSGPDGACGHPDHIAISQSTTAAIDTAADAVFTAEIDGAAAHPHSVSKLYYVAWPQSTWRAYQAAVQTLSTTVDGVERHANPRPDRTITTAIDTSDRWPTVWRAVSCRESQHAVYERLRELPLEHHRTLWDSQSSSCVPHRQRRPRAGICSKE